MFFYPEPAAGQRSKPPTGGWCNDTNPRRQVQASCSPHGLLVPYGVPGALPASGGSSRHGRSPAPRGTLTSEFDPYVRGSRKQKPKRASGPRAAFPTNFPSYPAGAPKTYVQRIGTPEGRVGSAGMQRPSQMGGSRRPAVQVGTP